jgi:hypothetical protein
MPYEWLKWDTDATGITSALFECARPGWGLGALDTTAGFWNTAAQ